MARKKGSGPIVADGTGIVEDGIVSVTGCGQEDAFSVGTGNSPAVNAVHRYPFPGTLCLKRLPFRIRRNPPVAAERLPGSIIYIIVVAERRLPVRGARSEPKTSLILRAIAG